MEQSRPKLRIPAIVCAAGICLISGACSKLGLGDSPTSPSGPPKAGSTINYSAIGASDVTGVGSSQPCLFPCSNGMGYVFVTERALRSQGYTVNLTPLGVPTATISRDFALLGDAYGHEIFRDVNLVDEASFVTKDATLVTVFAGGNDVEVVMSALGGGAGGATLMTQTAFIDKEIAAFASDYATLLAAARGRAPKARVVVMNLPNFAGIPLHAGDPLLNRQALQRLSVGMTKEINKLTSDGVIVIDLMCDPRFYQPANFSSDGFHPNDAGYAIMSGLIVQAATSSSTAAPLASCAQMTMVQ
jgi:lysophospholipase L1-like esterase